MSDYQFKRNGFDKTMEYCQDSIGFVIEEARTVRKVVEEAKLTSSASATNPYDYFTKILRNRFFYLSVHRSVIILCQKRY